MKTTTKIFLILMSISCSYAVGQVDTIEKYPETAIIKVIEGNSFGLTNVDSRMFIISPDNQIEMKVLRRVNYLFDGNEGIEFNAKTLRNELQIWHNKGFQVKSTSSVAPRESVVITTYILQKN